MDNKYIILRFFKEHNLTQDQWDRICMGYGKYEWDYDFRNTTIKQLPDNLYIKGDLDISETKITKLPNNLNIGFSFYMTNTPITEFPEDIKFGEGKIYIDDDRVEYFIEKYPELEDKIY